MDRILLATKTRRACPERSRRACPERSRRACPERSRRACPERSRRACPEHIHSVQCKLREGTENTSLTLVALLRWQKSSAVICGNLRPIIILVLTIKRNNIYKTHVF